MFETMKKITNILLGLLVLAGMLVSCDPMTENGPSEGQEVYTAEDIANYISATPVQLNGKNTNKIVVENKAKVDCQWRAAQLIEDSTVSASAYDTIYVTKTGANAVRFHGRNFSTNIIKDLSVNVDQITYLTSDLMSRLCITGSEGKYTAAKDGAPTSFGNTFSAASVKVVQEMTSDGKKGNRLYVYNTNPTLSNWTFGTSKSDKNVATVFVSNTGTYPLSLKYTKADGTSATLDLGTYTVEAFSYIPDYLVNLFGENGVKTWEWDDKVDPCWGNGSFGGDKKPSWWGLNLAGLDAKGATLDGGVAENGAAATFTFNLGNMTMTKSSGTVGTFSFDMDDIYKAGWNIGTMKFKNVNIPLGFKVNNGNTVPDKFYIVNLDATHLVLCWMSDNGSEGWYSCFKAKTE